MSTSKKRTRTKDAARVAFDGELRVPARILSMDGGGIYGLTQAIWLRHLCKEDPNFLKEGEGEAESYTLAGASAGAVNALLLAAAPNPREFLESGELEKFWSEPGLYVNRANPMDAFLSFFFITPWIGTEDTMAVLKSYFGDKTIGDITRNHPHRKIVISTFNWHGRPPALQNQDVGMPDAMWALSGGMGDMFRRWMTRMMPAMAGFAGGGQGTGAPDIGGIAGRLAGDPVFNGRILPWHPKMFTNFDFAARGYHKPANDPRFRLADLAFGAMAMPGIRSVRAGIGDAGIFNANPSMDALAASIKHQTHVEELAKADGASGVGPGDDESDVDLEEFNERAMVNVLKGLHMLSLGNGQVQPYYLTPNIPWGMLPYTMLPVNAPFGRYKPNDYMLNQALQEATMQVQALLGDDFKRLNPFIMKWPVGPLVWAVRSDFLRSGIIQKIQEAAGSPDSLRAVRRAAAFTKNGWSKPPKTKNA